MKCDFTLEPKIPFSDLAKILTAFGVFRKILKFD